MKKIIIGTRGSKLSLIQTTIIKNQLQALLPSSIIEIKTITTKGDKNMSPVPLDSVGKGWFTKEIDRELLRGNIDIAVHSLKDLPEELPKDLIIAAIPRREDPREALVTAHNLSFSQLPRGAIIGTDSTRRKAQILHNRPDLVVKSVRGNVLTRLEKLDSGQYDGLFLAVAGLKRLELENRISEYFSLTDIIPSPGQGALAVVVKQTNKKLRSLLTKLNDTETVIAVNAERTFSKAIGGGCKMPVGAYAACQGDTITIHAVIGSLDGKQLEKDSITGAVEDAEIIAEKLADSLLKISKPWYRIAEAGVSKYIVITRPIEEDHIFNKQVEELGLQTFLYPAIEITKSSLSVPMKKQLQNLAAYDWILFTSRNGVRFFIEALKELTIDTSILRSKEIGAVGPKTKEALENYGFKVHFIPSEFTTENLAKEIKNIRSKKIFLPRSQIASTLLTELLEKKGAIVTNIPMYHTRYTSTKNNEFIKLLDGNKIYMLTFTSPSTIEGFVRSIPEKMQKHVFGLPVLSIGPVTSTAAKKHGFTNIVTAHPYTIDGMLLKLKENILY